MQFGTIERDSVGSLPRPSWLARPSAAAPPFALEGAALREAQDDATLMALREQEDLASTS